jgi:hypothetical protein
MAEAENGVQAEPLLDEVAEYDADAQQFDAGEGDTSATAQDESAVEDPVRCTHNVANMRTVLN